MEFTTCALNFITFQDAFIGFGGNQVRKRVQEQSKWFVTTFQELTDELHRKSVKCLDV